MKKFKSKKKYVASKKNKQREASRAVEEADVDSVPRSLVYLKGKHGKTFQHLKDDFVKTMLPYTAKNFELRKKDTTRELIKFAIETTVTHLMEFSQTEKGSHLRIARLPKGPTLYFNVEDYSSTNDLKNFAKEDNNLRIKDINSKYPAVVILNQFNSTDKDHIKLVGSTLQNMFPAVNLKKFDYNTTKRVVLFDYNNEEDRIYMRQFQIKQTKNSEATKKINVNLVETGPRMTLSLVKIVEEVFDGDTIFHSFIEKTPEEIEEAKKRKKHYQALKESRKQQQEENVEKKKKAKEDKKNKQQEKVSKIRQEGHEKMEKYLESNINEEEEDDDDDEYYRMEVGEAPPEELELKTNKRKNEENSGEKKTKKRKK
eukprot:gene783-9033_t